MRLGQLARKLALRPSQIVDYLSAKGIFNEEGSNARLSDEIANQVILHFAPHRVTEILSADETIQEPSVLPAKPEVLMIENKSKVEKEIAAEAISALPVTLPEEKPEVIKAPKVELSGLKVLGKIDLPEPKKKVSVETSEECNHSEDKPEAEKKPVRREPQNNFQRRESYKKRPARNPMAELREKNAREEEAKRNAKAERDKEKRTQYYFQRVKTGQPTKAVKLMAEPVETYSSKDVRPEPKTWWGKFLRWLNS